MRSAPHTLYYLEHHIHGQNLKGIISELLQEGVIGRISLTPTDVLHCSGAYQNGRRGFLNWLRRRAAADQMGVSLEEYIRAVHGKITQMLNCDAIQAAMYFDRQGFDIRE